MRHRGGICTQSLAAACDREAATGFFFFFFFNDTATTEIYTLSLHDALPISSGARRIARAIRPSCGRRASTSLPDTERAARSEEHTSELQSQSNLVCRLLLEKKKHGTRRARSPSAAFQAAPAPAPPVRSCFSE